MPDATCPQCKGPADFTGKYHFYNRVYQCKRCNCIFASPTTWAKCKLKGIVGVDEFRNECTICENFPANPNVLRCPWFLGQPTPKEWEAKYGHARTIDVETEPFDAKKERLKLERKATPS